MSSSFPPYVDALALRPARARSLAAFIARVRGEIGHHAILIVTVAIYCAVIYTVLALTGQESNFLFGQYLIAAAMPIVLVVAFRALGELVEHALHARPFSFKGVWWGIRESEIFSLERAAAGLFPALLVPVFSAAFTAFKQSIPVFHPFSLDRTLMQADRAIHFGVQPWEWLHPWLANPWLTSGISYLYNLWIPLMWLVVYWQIFRLRDRALRMQFLLAFVFCWAVLGSLLALVFSSAGPCFYGSVVDGPNPYAGLMDYLHGAHQEVKIWSVVGQQFLWDNYVNGYSQVGGGIAAMPSLHVAVAILLLLMSLRVSRTLAWISGFYAALVMAGSVHLGWHYALDGYLGAAGALLAWALAGWLVRRVVPPPRVPEAVPAPA